jgi:hypothetical protein
MNITRTIMIFNETSDHGCTCFLSLKGDYSRFDAIVINVNDEDGALCDLLYDSDGKFLHEASDKFPHDFYLPGQTAVIVCAFAP